MSADNGIYIMESPVEGGEGKSEFRVAYGQAIENIDYYEAGGKEAIAMENAYFGESKVYRSSGRALKAAQKMEAQMLESGDYLEYGVTLVKPREFPFEQMSKTEYCHYLGWPVSG